MGRSRTGAFDRELLGLGVPPGEGGLDEALTTPLEYMYGGDTAVAAMQCAHMQSWMSFVSDASRARDGARTLFDTVSSYCSKRPASHRPRLVIFGMSLGALGAADTFSSLAGLTVHTSGAPFVGPPDGTALLWTEPAWLSEARGPGVVSAMQWFPFITVWQVTGDLRIDPIPPSGYGHNYASMEIDTAWSAVLHPPSWTDADTAALATATRSLLGMLVGVFGDVRLPAQSTGVVRRVLAEGGLPIRQAFVAAGVDVRPRPALAVRRFLGFRDVHVVHRARPS